MSTHGLQMGGAVTPVAASRGQCTGSGIGGVISVVRGLWLTTYVYYVVIEILSAVSRRYFQIRHSLCSGPLCRGSTLI